MRKMKNNLSENMDGNITVDPTLKERYGNKLLFQHKLDRLRTLLKGTKLDLTIATSRPKV